MSVNAAGDDSGNGASTMPGRIVDWPLGLAFNSEATDLGPRDTNGAPDVYLRPDGSDVTELVSTNTTKRNSGNGPSRIWAPRGLSSGPLLIESEATDLGPSVGGSTQIYVAHRTVADVSFNS